MTSPDASLIAYPVSPTRAVVVGPIDEIEALGRPEEALSAPWLRLLRQAAGAAGPLGDLAQQADGRLVRLTAESANLLRQHAEVHNAAGQMLGVVRNPQTGQLAGVLSFQTGALVGAAAALPALLSAVAMQRQLAAIERKLDELQAQMTYVIDQLHLGVEGDLIASLDILDRVFERVQQTGQFHADDWQRVVDVEVMVRSLHHQTSRRLAQIADQIVPGGSVASRVQRLRTVLQSQKASFWLAAHVRAELALTKWEWLEVMRLADQERVDDIEGVVGRVQAEVVGRRAALEHLATRLGAFVAVGDDDLLDRVRFILRRRLTNLTGELDATLSAFRLELAPLGVDARVPIALGAGEEDDGAWDRLRDQLLAGRRFVDRGLDGVQRTYEKVRRRSS